MFADDQHAPVEVTWGVYQNLVDAYRNPDRAAGRQAMQKSSPRSAAASPQP